LVGRRSGAQVSERKLTVGDCFDAAPGSIPAIPDDRKCMARYPLVFA